ncbi:MAG: glycosyltransferase family 9 protein [Bacteroidetes bacterium]|nr:glycosyltransferase family 9 protein [Bacteroidota bacterium]
MADNNILSNCIYGFFRKFFSVAENPSLDIGKPKNILVVRQHNQLGDLLAGVSLLRAIKETYPDCHLTLIVSPSNYSGVIKNRFVDELFVFDKKKIFNPSYIMKFIKILQNQYEVCIVPVTVSISFTSNLISRFSNSKIRIGAKSLDGNENKSAFLFDRLVKIDWRKHPDSNVAERSLDIVRPFGINTNNYRSDIYFDKDDIETAEKFIAKINSKSNYLLIGFHIGAGKIPNRWSLKKYLSLMEKLKENYPVKFYLTGSNSDAEEIDYIKKNAKFETASFLNKKITEVAALISKSDLFISNDTGIMHVAGSTETPQISIFGPTNPFNWAPIGANKFFIRKSELIDDVTVEDVYKLCEQILNQKLKRL